MKGQFVADCHVWFLCTGTRAPYLVDVVKEDGEHLIAGTVPGRNGFSAVKKAPAKLS